MNKHDDPEWELVRLTAARLFAVNKGDGELSPWDVDLWRSTYPEADSGAFLEALRGLARTGQTWMPKAPQFAALLAPPEGEAAVSWTEVWNAIESKCFRVKNGLEAGRIVEHYHGRIAGAWVASAWTRIQGTDFDPEHRPKLVGMFGKQYEAFAAAQAERLARGLEVASPDQALARGDGGLRKPSFAVPGMPAQIGSGDQS